MNKSRPDVIQLLNLEKEYHAEQLRRIDVALAALKGEVVKSEASTPITNKKRTIKWAEEIRTIFDTGVEINLKELRDTLVENGIPEAIQPSGKNAVYSTVSRLKSRGVLERTNNGKYRKKPRIIRRRTIPDNEIEEELDQT